MAERFFDHLNETGRFHVIIFTDTKLSNGLYKMNSSPGRCCDVLGWCLAIFVFTMATKFGLAGVLDGREHAGNSQDNSRNNLTPELDKEVEFLPIATPEPGVRLYGITRPYATWTDTSLAPDGRWLVGFQRGKLHVWDRRANRLEREIVVTDFGQIQRTEFSPSGKYFVVVVKHWRNLPDATTAWPDAEVDADNLLGSLILNTPEYESQVLIYDQEWNLAGSHRFPIDLCHIQNSLAFSPDERFILLNCSGQSTIIDIETHSVKAVPRANRPGFFISGSEIGFPITRNTWDWQKNSIGVLPDDFLPNAESVEELNNSDWLIAETMAGCALVQRSTNRKIALSGWDGLVYGSLSANEQYFAGLCFSGDVSQIRLFDLSVGRELVLADTPNINDVAFLKSEPEKVYLYPANPRFISNCEFAFFPIVATVIDANFSRKSLEVHKRVPATEQIMFAGRDEWVTLAKGLTWLRVSDGKTVSKTWTSDGVAMAAADPHRADAYTIEIPANTRSMLTIHSHSAEETHEEKVLTLRDTMPIWAMLGRLFGHDDRQDSRRARIPVHLSCSHRDSMRRIVYFESGFESEMETYPGRYRFIKHRLDIPSRMESKFLEAPSWTPDLEKYMDLSADGRVYAVAHGNRLWLGDTESEKLVREICLPGIATGVRISADNRLACVALIRTPWERSTWWRGDPTAPLATSLAVIEIETGVTCFEKRQIEIAGFGFHPLTHQLYVLDRNHQPGKKRMTFYETATWKLTFQHETAYSLPLGMALGNDGNLVAITLADSRVECWEIDKIKAQNNLESKSP